MQYFLMNYIKPESDRCIFDWKVDSSDEHFVSLQSITNQCYIGGDEKMFDKEELICHSGQVFPFILIFVPHT